MRRLYADYDTAARRVERLKEKGVWPGIVGPDAAGDWHLTFDPGDGGE